jgi:hypothetical protein
MSPFLMWWILRPTDQALLVQLRECVQRSERAFCLGEIIAIPSVLMLECASTKGSFGRVISGS